MANLNKNQIKNKLSSYVARYASQNVAANTLKNVSAATVSQILNDKWEKISDEMWRNIASQIGMSQWQLAETRCYELITETFRDAQMYANTHALTAQAGSGKSYTAIDYVANNQHAYHIVCCEWWTPQSFFSEILRVIGLGSKAVNNDNSAMIEAIVSELQRQSSPVLIFDEADKVQDKVFCGIISLYNRLEGMCGLVLMATENLERRMLDGVRHNRRGYNEVYSRIGRRFLAVRSNYAEDIVKVCIANGLTDQELIDKVISDCDFDLRRVKRYIHSRKIKEQANG